MSQTHLRRRILGRVIRPVAFFLMLSMLVTVWSTVSAAVTAGTNYGGLAGDVIGAVAAVSAGLLAWGWWAHSDRWLTAGLSGATATWVGITTLTIADYGWPTVSALFSLCWVGIAASTYLLERRGGPRA